MAENGRVVGADSKQVISDLAESLREERVANEQLESALDATQIASREAKAQDAEEFRKSPRRSSLAMFNPAVVAKDMANQQRIRVLTTQVTTQVNTGRNLTTFTNHTTGAAVLTAKNIATGAAVLTAKGIQETITQTKNITTGAAKSTQGLASSMVKDLTSHSQERSDGDSKTLVVAKVQRKMAKSYSLLMIMATVGVICQIWAAELVFEDGNEESDVAFRLKAVVTGTTIVLLRLLYVHYTDALFLGKLKGEYHESDSLATSRLLLKFLLEMSACAMHCPPGWIVTFEVHSEGIISEYTPDAWCSVLICCRLYLIIRFMHNLNHSNNSVVALTLGGIGSVEFTPWHTFKQMLMQTGMTTVSNIFCLLTVLHGHALRAAERPTNEPFNNFISCIWCSVVTMTTVGYGDMYPSSHIGRIIAVSASIFGTIILALLVTAITKATELEKSESLFALMVRESEDKMASKKAAAVVVVMTIKAMVARKRAANALLLKNASKPAHKTVLHDLKSGLACMTDFGSSLKIAEQRLSLSIRHWRRAQRRNKGNRMRRLQHDPHAPIGAAVIANAELLQEIKEADDSRAVRMDRMEGLLANIALQLDPAGVVKLRGGLAPLPAAAGRTVSPPGSAPGSVSGGTRGLMTALLAPGSAPSSLLEPVEHTTVVGLTTEL
jgi:hypothetical protein